MIRERRPAWREAVFCHLHWSEVEVMTAQPVPRAWPRIVEYSVDGFELLTPGRRPCRPSIRGRHARDVTGCLTNCSPAASVRHANGSARCCRRYFSTVCADGRIDKPTVASVTRGAVFLRYVPSEASVTTLFTDHVFNGPSILSCDRPDRH
jgi:hypothetical protein